MRIEGTGAGPGPESRRAIRAYHEYQADCIVAEVNFGADMVKTIIGEIDPNVNFKKVRAARKKMKRAEPVVALYEEGRIIHTKVFDDLEDQMTGWTPDSSISPDRIDAAVWLFFELILNKERLMIY